ncbi:MAG: hypothetical protein NVS2B9_18200 [Myxococcales bacterium]
MRLVSKTFAFLSIALAASAGARAEECQDIDTLITTTYALGPGCASPVGICTVGTIASGPLAGTTRFTALTVAQGATPYQLVYTGELVIAARGGTVTLRDFGVFDAFINKYFELQQVFSGTRKYALATGALTSSGIGTATGFAGTLTGQICRGGRDRDDEQDSE